MPLKRAECPYPNAKQVLLGFLECDAGGGCTRETGGQLASKVDLLLNVPSNDAQCIQECHITIGHIACSLIEKLASSQIPANEETYEIIH